MKQFSLLLTLVALFLLSACSAEERKFSEVRRLRKDNLPRATQLAAELKETPRGIQLALRDFNIYGGTTRGVSSWMLHQSTLKRDVETSLKGIITNPKEPLDRRFEAIWILWLRSGESDLSLLDAMFELARQPNGNTVTKARRKLTAIFRPEAADLRKALSTSGRYAIPLSLAEFQRMAHDQQIILRDQRAPQ